MPACGAGKLAFAPFFRQAEEFFAVWAGAETVCFEISDTKTKIFSAVNDFRYQLVQIQQFEQVFEFVVFEPSFLNIF